MPEGKVNDYGQSEIWHNQRYIYIYSGKTSPDLNNFWCYGNNETLNKLILPILIFVNLKLNIFPLSINYFTQFLGQKNLKNISNNWQQVGNDKKNHRSAGIWKLNNRECEAA